MIFDSASVILFPNIKFLNYILALLNTKISEVVLNLIAPTLNTQPGDIAKLPIIIDESMKENVESAVEENIEMCKIDWDSFETSWDFEGHPLV